MLSIMLKLKLKYPKNSKIHKINKYYIYLTEYKKKPKIFSNY